MARSVFWITLLLGSLQFSFAQEDLPALARNLMEVHGATLQWHPATQRVRFVRFPNTNSLDLAGDDLSARCLAFLATYQPLFGLSDATQELQHQHTHIDLASHTHVVFHQFHHGIPVFDGDLRFHFDQSGRLLTISGQCLPTQGLPTTPTLPIAEAAAAALRFATKAASLSGDVGEMDIRQQALQVFHAGLVRGRSDEVRLTYTFEISNEGNFRQHYYIDAQTGTLLASYNGLCSVLNRRLYEQNFSNLTWAEGDPYPASLDTWQQTELTTAGQAYYFFENAFGYTSFDDADADMLTVHNHPALSCPNANWNGVSTNYCDQTGADDVVAHEWGHAYTEYTSNLIYAWQAGAINEAYSDIWGETIDLINNYGVNNNHFLPRNACNSNDRWLIGEDASAFGSALRDMWDPTCKNDPGKISDAEYHCDSSDDGGVHTNSGIPNHAYALLVDGGAYNGQVINPLGLTKTAHIFWQAHRYYLTRTSDFAFLAESLEAAAADLIGVNLPALSTGSSAPGLSGITISAGDLLEVAKAINAVEMRADPGCPQTPLLASPRPELCANPVEPWQVIFNEDFEGGAGAWTSTEHPENAASWDSRQWAVIDNLPNQRAGKAMYGPTPFVGNCNTDLDNGLIRLESPLISVPVEIMGTLYLQFDHYLSIENDWDGGNLQYQRNGGTWLNLPLSAFTFNGYNEVLMNAPLNDNPLQGQRAFSGSDGGSVAGSWGSSQVDLSSLAISAGDQLRLRWELGTDGCNGWDGWYIDDIEIGFCGAAILPVEWGDFRVTPEEGHLQLSWQTLAESSNAGFYLERRKEGSEAFQSIAWIDGQGDFDLPSDYSYQDKNVEAGPWYYYRLRQVDFDGSSSYSPIRSGRLEPSQQAGLIAVFPNPAKDQLQLLVRGQQGIPFNLQLLHSNGRVVMTKSGLTAGNEMIGIQLPELPIGFYHLRFISGEATYTLPVVIE